MFGKACWHFALISFIISFCLTIDACCGFEREIFSQPDSVGGLLRFLMFWFFPGFRGSVDANGFPVGQYPEIRGTGYVESNDPVQVGGGAPQQRVFRNSQPATPPPNYGVSPSYQARQYEEQLYNFQNFNGQYYGANGKKWRWIPPLLHINKTVII